MSARQPMAYNARRQQVARVGVVPAPTGGYDASSALAGMEPDRAVSLLNWFPQPGWIEIRRGYTTHATGVGDSSTAVDTLMAYNGPGATKQLFAAGGGAIYDVTSYGVATSVVTGLNDNRWQWVNFVNSGSTYLYCVNGTDAPRHYNGTTWATPSLTGVTSTDLVNITVHKKRIWFIIKDSMKACYLATDAIAGALTEFALGSVFARGGYLVAMATWTRDGGSGSDDYAAFITSRGQVAVYSGTDPSSAATWSLVGVFDVGVPVGRRCFRNYGADVLLITVSGVFPLSQLLSVDQAQRDLVALTRRISHAVNEDARDYQSLFGWELCVYPKGTRMILNIPTAEGETAKQYVMNTETGAWCEFDSHDAMTWIEFDDDLYFGGPNGRVYQADTTSADDRTPIVAVGETAYQPFSSPGTLKRFSMIQPLLTTTGDVRPGVGVSVDFVSTAELSTPSYSQSINALFDVAQFDVATFAGEAAAISDWTSSSALGRFASIKFQAETGTDATRSTWDSAIWNSSLWGPPGTSEVTLRINGFVLTYETGGIL